MKFLVYFVAIVSLSDALRAETQQDQSRKIQALTLEAKTLLVESYRLSQEVLAQMECNDRLLERYIVYIQLLLKLSDDEKLIFEELLRIAPSKYDPNKRMIEEALYHDFTSLDVILIDLKTQAQECLQKESQEIGSKTVAYPLRT